VSESQKRENEEPISDLISPESLRSEITVDGIPFAGTQLHRGSVSQASLHYHYFASNSR